MLNEDIGIKSQFCVLVPIFCIIMVIFSFFNVSFLNYSTSNLQASNLATLQMVSKQPELISSFSTNYKDSPEERKFNIRLALKSLDGKSIMPGEEFSFNKVVGLRTEERGYKKALVIFKGRYTEGVGGGVCQVSSTLYNAWLLGGLDVVSVTAHSLPSSYVELSRDATVSEYIDLILRNPTDAEIFIATNYDEEKITINLFGKKRDCEYKLQSETIKVIPYEEEIIELDEVGENEFFIGKDGYISRLILSIEKGGRTLSKREIRRDYYKPQNSVKILRKSVANWKIWRKTKQFLCYYC